MRPSPPRAPSARCPKAPNPGKEAGPKEFRFRIPAPPAMVDRIVKRVSATTISRMAAEGTILPSYEEELIQHRPRTAPSSRSSKENGKSHIQRYRRPTTASRYRNFCGFCTDPGLQEYLELDYGDEDAVDDEELQDIVKRLRTPTQASTLASRQGSASRCRKRSIVQEPNKSLPLLCGLDKSRNVDEITHRLYTTPTFAIASKANCKYNYNNKKERRKRLEATSITSTAE